MNEEIPLNDLGVRIDSEIEYTALKEALLDCSEPIDLLPYRKDYIAYWPFNGTMTTGKDGWYRKALTLEDFITHLGLNKNPEWEL